ncbi:hypothetical protein BEP19_02910 [Ammoniphilus oxalaticus]|uniref:Response regulatory domain-containing protein n=1 Tax=Ammoniphilus oxalaticus TaxID=66863 RepID=A0A419SNL3_9BACL|nr:response regulator [Ammoniphilus oxalaticus]RKD25894.1 hypothetical protein BEP19_02910 [Ammoniphilus oxalaticus]
MRAILVDDEPLALDFLEHQINKISNIVIVEKLTNLEIAEREKLLQNIDLVFLDIEMPGKNGLELAEQLLEVNKNLAIVFVTAFHEYAVQAFELNALDYVLKPAQTDRLQKTITRIKTQLQDRSRPLARESKLQFNLFGKLTYNTSGNSPRKVIQWRTSKAQECFLYLLHHQKKTAQKSELIELLWPDVDEQRAFSQLYTTIYHIRKTLSHFGEHCSIKNTSEGYILLLNDVHIDAVEWEEKLTSLPPLTQETLTEYEAALNFYTGAYLQDYDYLWAEPERYRLEQRWLQYAYMIADHYNEHDNFEKAKNWYTKICSYKAEDERAHFQLMIGYASFGAFSEVERQYNQMKIALAELDLAVSPHVKKWYEQWRTEVVKPK